MEVRKRVDNGIAISVILATRNRASSLARLLDGLTGQVDPPRFELIVADNGSSDDTPAVVEQAAKKLDVRYVREERPGKGKALNAALREARGELIIFTDDDVQPCPDWLFQMHKAAQDYPECNVFGGRIDVDMQEAPMWVRKAYNLNLLTTRYDKGDQDQMYTYGEYPLGPNMAIRSRLLIGVPHPYPEDVGPGTRQPVGDETRFFWPLSPPDARDRIYIAGSCVQHTIEAENVAFWSALRRCFLSGRARGWLGVPPAKEILDGSTSTMSVIGNRLRACRSIRELACISSRYLGYRYGCRERRTGRSPDMHPLCRSG